MNIVFEQVDTSVVASYTGSFANWNGTDGEEVSYASNALVARLGESSGYFTSLDSNFWELDYSILSGTMGGSIPFADGFTFANSQDGDAFSVSFDTLILPNNYTSDTEISGSITFTNTEIADLEYEPGALSAGSVFTFSGYTFNVSVVPEPSTYAVL
ncbi:MAG: hypothetical protein ACQKBV_13255 [Puniceicoccales bacterium]